MAHLPVGWARAQHPVVSTAAGLGIAGVDDTEGVLGTGVAAFEAVPGRRCAGRGIDASSVIAAETGRAGVAAAAAVRGVAHPGGLVDAIPAAAGAASTTARQAARRR